MRYWLGIGVVCLVLTGAAMLCSWPGAEQVRATLQSAGDCTHYVDNQAPSDGDGSLTTPWDNIAGHVGDLRAGDVMCVRGDLAPPGRVYTEPTIVVDNNSGTEEDPITIRTYPGEQVTIHGIGFNMVEFKNVHRWHLDGFALDMESKRGWAVDFYSADHITIRNCEIHNGRGGGVHWTQGNYNIVDNCKVHDFNDGPYIDAHCLDIEGGQGNVIQNSEIYNCAGDGVYFGLYNDVFENTIQYNHFYTTKGACTENAIDVKAGNPIIRGNVMHGFRYCDGHCGGSGGTIGEPIVIHMKATGAVIEGNHIYDCASAMRTTEGDNAINVLIVNNLIHDIYKDPDAWGTDVFGLYYGGNVTVTNNTVAHAPGRLMFIRDSLNSLDLRNNLFYNTGAINGWTDADYNGWFNAAQRIEGTHDVVAADPRFVSPDDYHLRGSSQAVDAGDNPSAPAQDFDGNSRPYGPITDLGAFEAQEPPPVTDLRVSEGVTTTDSVTITLTWTAPGRVGQSSTADHYELRYDDQVITQESWDQAIIADADIAAGQPGEAQRTTVSLPWSGSGHLYFALRVFDVDSLGSEVSNPAFWPFESVHLPLVRATAAS